jgi:hypothetical protein
MKFETNKEIKLFTFSSIISTILSFTLILSAQAQVATGEQNEKILNQFLTQSTQNTQEVAKYHQFSKPLQLELQRRMSIDWQNLPITLEDFRERTVSVYSVRALWNKNGELMKIPHGQPTPGTDKANTNTWGFGEGTGTVISTNVKGKITILMSNDHIIGGDNPSPIRAISLKGRESAIPISDEINLENYHIFNFSYTDPYTDNPKGMGFSGTREIGSDYIEEYDLSFRVLKDSQALNQFRQFLLQINHDSHNTYFPNIKNSIDSNVTVSIVSLPTRIPGRDQELGFVRRSEARKEGLEVVTSEPGNTGNTIVALLPSANIDKSMIQTWQEQPGKSGTIGFMYIENKRIPVIFWGMRMKSLVSDLTDSNLVRLLEKKYNVKIKDLNESQKQELIERYDKDHVKALFVPLTKEVTDHFLNKIEQFER